jgi:hypothetical protein
VAQRKDVADASNWVGWVYFAGFLLLMLGIFHALAGVVALFKDEVYAVAPNSLWILDYTTWGWAHIVFGAILITGAMSLFYGRMWGRIVGVVMALLSAIANFSFIPVYPIWSVLMIVLSGFVLYALVVHGAEANRELE